jgi:hypothetical protein
MKGRFKTICMTTGRILEWRWSRGRYNPPVVAQFIGVCSSVKT